MTLSIEGFHWKYVVTFRNGKYPIIDKTMKIVPLSTHAPLEILITHTHTHTHYFANAKMIQILFPFSSQGEFVFVPYIVGHCYVVNINIICA